MLPEEFEKLVQRAIVGLPPNIRKKMDNIAVCIEQRPSQAQIQKTGIRISNALLGLYEGVPKTAWGRERFSVRLPDKITIFREPIENLARQRFFKKNVSAAPQLEKEIAELIKIVVWHEVAHHFGFPEKEVRALEKKWRGQ